MKPEVLKQIKELEAEREKMRQNTGQVMLHRPGEEPRVLRSQELVQLIQSQQQDIKTLNEKVQELSKGPPYEELENRLRKIQMLEGLVARLREELQNAKSESASNVSSLLPSPPILSQEHNVQPISITSNVSKIIPEFAVTIPIVAV